MLLVGEIYVYTLVIKDISIYSEGRRSCGARELVVWALCMKLIK